MHCAQPFYAPRISASGQHIAALSTRDFILQTSMNLLRLSWKAGQCSNHGQNDAVCQLLTRLTKIRLLVEGPAAAFMARSWLIDYMRLAESRTNCQLRTGCGFLPCPRSISALNLSGKDISIYGQRHAVMAQPTQPFGTSLGPVRICLFCRQNVYLRGDFSVGDISSFILAIKREGILMGIKLRTAFLRLPLRNEFTAQAAFFAFDLP